MADRALLHIAIYTFVASFKSLDFILLSHIFICRINSIAAGIFIVGGISSSHLLYIRNSIFPRGYLFFQRPRTLFGMPLSLVLLEKTNSDSPFTDGLSKASLDVREVDISPAFVAYRSVPRARSFIRASFIIIILSSSIYEEGEPW